MMCEILDPYCNYYRACNRAPHAMMEDVEMGEQMLAAGSRPACSWKVSHLLEPESEKVRTTANVSFLLDKSVALDQMLFIIMN
jgi:hypothetical protein